LILALTGMIAFTAPAVAGIGSSISASTSIDTKPPFVTVDQFPQFTLYQGGDMVTFHWLSGDDNLGDDPAYFVASVMIEGQVASTFNYHPDIEEASWQWMAPDVSSANVHLEVLARDAFGNATIGSSNSFTVLSSVTDVPAASVGLELEHPAPNPFNPSTKLQFNLPEPGSVNLVVYDPRGRRVRTLVSGQRAAGAFATSWDGRDDRGRAQSGGVYIFVLEFKGAHESGRISRKAVLIP
jgi:hypothetical protein